MFALLVIGLSGCLSLFLQVSGSLDYHKIHTESCKANGLRGLPGPGEAIKLVPVQERGAPPPARAFSRASPRVGKLGKRMVGEGAEEEKGGQGGSISNSLD